MILLWGVLLGAGLVLVSAPWVWPRSGAREGASVARDDFATRTLREAGYPTATAAHLIVVSLGVGALAGAVAFLVTSVPAVAIVAIVAACAAPMMLLRRTVRRRRHRRRAMWPDVCDLLIASVRAGMSLPDAVASLEESAPPELRPAFAGFARDLAASGHFDAAILRAKAVLADPVADRIIESLRMARQVGGTELTSVLRGLSASVRAESAVRAEVDARQSWIRGAAVLGVVAPWVILVLLSLRPEGSAAYSSPAGVVVIVAGAVVSVIAFRLMLRIGRLPEPRRWFA